MYHYIENATSINISLDYKLSNEQNNKEYNAIGLATTALSNSGLITGSNIIALRNMLGPLGSAIKFQPWEAIGLASDFSKFLGVAGIAISIFSKIMTEQQKAAMEEKFKQGKEKIVICLEQGKQDTFNIFNANDFIQKAFPQMDTVKDAFAQIQRSSDEGKETLEKIKQWQKDVRDFCQSYAIKLPTAKIIEN